MEHQIPLPASARGDFSTTNGDGTRQIIRDLAFQNHVFVNVGFVGVPYTGNQRWVLVDAAIPGSAGSVAKAVAKRFGAKARLAAIPLTHAHFDHVGALKDLAEKWDAPIYAHPLELPCLGRPRFLPAGAHARACLVLARGRRHASGGRRVCNHQVGERLQGELRTGTRDARAAAVSHARLGQRQTLGGNPRRTGAEGGVDRPRPSRA